jgi:hypothetical protein
MLMMDYSLDGNHMTRRMSYDTKNAYKGDDDVVHWGETL